MLKKIVTVGFCVLLVVFAVVIAVIIAVNVFQKTLPNTTLRGVEPVISAANVINGSSTVGTNGAILWTNASSSGDWFRITNISNGRGFCGPAAATSSVSDSRGQLLVPHTSSTGSNMWEERGIKGPISCIGDGNFAVSYSYTFVAQ